MVKLNSVPVPQRNRPRIPTPDVTKELAERDQRLAISATNAANIGAGVVGVIPANYPTDIPVVQVVLSPIQETEHLPNRAPVKGSVGGTAALAQAVLSPTLTSAGLVGPVALTPATVSQLTQLGFMTTTMSPMPRITNSNNININNHHLNNQKLVATLTEVNSSEEESSGGSTKSIVSRNGSVEEHDERTILSIGERQSPLGSHGGSPIFNSYNDRSAILMNPEKLAGYIVETMTQGTNTETRERRSTSLPGPPVIIQAKEDRSMSLPHERQSQSGQSQNRHVNNHVAPGTTNGPRQRTSSVGGEPRPRIIQEPHRRISTPASTNANLLGGQNGAKGRGEVYV